MAFFVRLERQEAHEKAMGDARDITSQDQDGFQLSLE